MKDLGTKHGNWTDLAMGKSRGARPKATLYVSQEPGNLARGSAEEPKVLGTASNKPKGCKRKIIFIQTNKIRKKKR